MSKQNYRSEAAKKVNLNNGEESTDSLEGKVFNPSADGSLNGEYTRAFKKLKDIESKTRQLGIDTNNYYGKIKAIVYNFIPSQWVISSYLTGLEKSKAELENVRDRNLREMELISQKTADTEEAKGYAGVLLERYDFMLDEMASTRDEKREELMKARSEAAKNPGNGYHSIEKEVRAIDTDRRNIKMKQARAAQKIIAYEGKIQKYNGLLAVSNTTLQRAEDAYLRTESRIQKAKTLLETGVPSKSIVQIIGKTEKQGSKLDEITEKYEEGLYDGASVLRDLPKVGVSSNGNGESIEQKFIDSVETESDSYVDLARKILEKDRTAA